MSLRSLTIALTVTGITLVTGLAGSNPLEASDGLCRNRCVNEFGRCLDEAECRYFSCRRGGFCSPSGTCPDRSSCGFTPCNPSSCLEQREQCLAGCVDWIDRFEIPSLIDSLDLDPVLRDSLKDRLVEVVLGVGEGINAVQLESGKGFATFRSELAALADKQQLEPDMALALDQLATEAERQLRSAQLCEPSSGTPLLGGREMGSEDVKGATGKGDM